MSELRREGKSREQRKMNDSPAAQVYVLVGDTAKEPKKDARWPE